MNNKIKEVFREYTKDVENKRISNRTLFVQEYKEYIEKYPIKTDNILEKLHCIINNLTEDDIQCKECNSKKRIFKRFYQGYSDFCSISCATSHTNKLRDSSVYKKRKETYKNMSIEKKKKIREKWTKTQIENHGDNFASELGKKGYKNSVQRGTFKSGFEICKRDNPKLWDEIHKKVAEINKKNGHYEKIHKDKLNDIDLDGNNFYDRQHYRFRNEFDENGNNVYDRTRITNIKNGKWFNTEESNLFKQYTRRVWSETRKNNLALLENFELRARSGENAYHLDHIYSIFDGFKNNVPVFIIGNKCNLRMLKAKDNIIKNRKSDISLDNLIYNFYK